VATLGFLAVGWGILTPALVVLARRWDGFAPARTMRRKAVTARA
jgi:hypothetical protein